MYQHQKYDVTSGISVRSAGRTQLIQGDAMDLSVCESLLTVLCKTQRIYLAFGGLKCVFS